MKGIRMRRPVAWCRLSFLVMAASLAAWGAWGTSARAGEVTISKQGRDFAIVTPSYQARIDGNTGMLERMTIDGTVVIRETTIDLERRKFARIAVTRESPSRIVTYVSAEENHKMVDRALRIAYEETP